MKIPLVWLNDYIELNNTKKEIGEFFTKIGLMLDKPTTNNVLDLEHRMDRSDWLSIIGCARDLCAFKNVLLKYPMIYENNLPDIPIEDKIEVKVNCTNKVNRFKTIIIKNVQVAPSPDWLKERLELYGITSINNIVDITNYVMVEFGQPMHAQDIDKLQSKEIILRDANINEKITTLLGEQIQLVSENFVLTQNNVPTVVGGIVGGKDTKVTFNTKNIVLDAGNYNQTYIRKASRKLKIYNETVLRSDKFLNPNIIDIALKRAVYLILQIAKGEAYNNFDWYPNKVDKKIINLTYNRIYKISGMEFSKNSIVNILNNLEYKIINDNLTHLTIQVPNFRTDVELEDDVISDILRISDYQKIPTVHINSSPPSEITSEIYKFESKLKLICINLGLHEHITDSLIDKNYINKNDHDKTIILQNPLNTEKSALRTDIKQSLNLVYQNYLKHKIFKIGLFEVGNVYLKDANNNFIEKRILQIIYHNNQVSIYNSVQEFKSIISRLLDELSLNWNTAQKIWQIDATSMSVDLNELLKIYSPSNRVVTKINNYTTQDFSIILNLEFKFGQIYEKILNLNKNIISVEVVEQIKIDDKNKSVLVRVTFDLFNNQNLREEIINLINSFPLAKIRT